MLQGEIARWSVGRCLVVDPQSRTKLETLMGLWKRYAIVMNLTSSASDDALGKQILDGLDAVECALRAGVVLGETWLDVGSGGGFPGLVVAALGFPVVLMEPRERRAAFLELALASIKGKGAVRRMRADGSTWTEKLMDGGSEKFAVASARAVFEPREWLARAEALGRDGSVVLVHAKEEARYEGWDVVASVTGTLGVVAACRKLGVSRGT